MKKSVKIALSIILFLIVLAPLKNSIDNTKQRKNVSLFYSDVQNLNEKYNVLEQSDIWDENGKPVYSAFENRLIIKSDFVPTNNTADEIISGIGYVVLQYNDIDTLLVDYDMLNDKGYDVARDRIYYLSELSMTDAFDDNSSVDAFNSYGMIGEQYAKKIDFCSDEEIVIGVIDSGINYDHELFINRLDDADEPNFSSSGDRLSSADDNGHGTMVSGIIAQSTPDNVKIRPYKLADNYGTMTFSQIVAVFEHILAEKDAPDILNMSFSGYDMVDGENDILNSLVERMISRGISVCTSAGNDFAPAECYSPAGCPDVINVSSCSANGDFSSYSNYGDSVDICATGERIYTASLDGGYTSSYSGTSFSCPFASSACAYVIMQNPDITPAEIKDKICSSAIYQGVDDSYYFGSGILNFINLIEDKPFDTPMPSVSGGLYHDEQLVSFDVPEGTQLIYSEYPLGPIATASFTDVYSEPIVVDSDCILHYALVKNNEYVSRIETQEYVIQYYTNASDYTVVMGSIKSYNGDKTNIIVPDNIDATSVYRSAFENSNITSIVLPDKIDLLGTECFKNSSIKHIVANGVTKLNGVGVFYGCYNLRDEIMPRLETVSENAFQFCSMLHNIDFGENITKLKSDLFSYSGLLHADFPNADISLLSNDSVFKNASLLTCNLPKISELGKSFLEGNHLLYDLNCDNIYTMRAMCLKGTSSLVNFDVTNLRTLYSNALAGCYIRNFYAPLVTNLADMGTSFGEYCNCKIIDMPGFSESLGSKAFVRAKTEKFYFKNVPLITSANAFLNTPFIKEMYFPSVRIFYGPEITSPTSADASSNEKGIDYNQYPCPDIIWIPKAITVSALNVREGCFVYAPSATSVVYHSQNFIQNSILVLSALSETNQLSISADNNAYNLLSTIIAPDSSNLNINTDDYEFFSSTGCVFVGSEDGMLQYECGDQLISIPVFYIYSLWDSSFINKNIDNAPHQFLFDFTNDDLINAKDYAAYLGIIRNK